MIHLEIVLAPREAAVSKLDSAKKYVAPLIPDLDQLSRASRKTSLWSKSILRETAMEGVTSLNSSTANNSNSVCSTASIWQDVLSQAVTGELIAVLNYTSLAEICENPGEV